MVQCWVEMIVVLWGAQTNWWQKLIWQEQNKTSLAGAKNWHPKKILFGRIEELVP
jgi:hypothetical protein